MLDRHATVALVQAANSDAYPRGAFHLLVLGLRGSLLRLTGNAGQGDGLLTELVEIVRAGHPDPIAILARNMGHQEAGRTSEKLREGRYLRAQLDAGRVSRAYDGESAAVLSVSPERADPLLRREIEKALCSLTEQQRRCALLLLDEMTTSQISEALGIDAKSLIKRTREKMKVLLGTV